MKTIADLVVGEMGLPDVEYRFTGGDRGGRRRPPDAPGNRPPRKLSGGSPRSARGEHDPGDPGQVMRMKAILLLGTEADEPLQNLAGSPRVRGGRTPNMDRSPWRAGPARPRLSPTVRGRFGRREPGCRYDPRGLYWPGPRPRTSGSPRDDDVAYRCNSSR